MFDVSKAVKYWGSTVRSKIGIDPGSTRIALFELEDQPGTRARVSFFIMGSGEDSLDFRKRLLEMTSETIKKCLKEHQLDFFTQEPIVYVDSPVTL
jgi:Holliday junction resolvasome RuvABC endonuclease subunit